MKIDRAHKRWLALIATAILAAVGAVMWFSSAGGGREETSGSKGAVGHLSNREQWEKFVRRGLREEKTHRYGSAASPIAKVGEKRAMPVGLRKAALSNLRDGGALHLRWNHARYAKPPAGTGFWVVRGSGVTCMFQAVTAALSCSTTSMVERGGLELEVYQTGTRQQPTKFVVLGIAQGWVKAVKAIVGRRVVMIPVVDGVYGYRANVPIKMRHHAA